MADSPQEQESDLTGVEDISPLRQVTIEMHEMYKELLYSGFPQTVAEKIVAHILYDDITSRYEEGDDDFEDDDDEYDGEND